MIRFKKAVAADVPVPPEGYVTLFVDTATGQPSAKDSAGVVVSLKGTDGEDGDDGVAGLPEGGTAGQFLRRSADGATWADAPGGGPSSALVDVLADAYLFYDSAPTNDPHSFALVQYEYENSGASRGVDIVFPAPAGKVPRRVVATIVATLAGEFTSSEYSGTWGDFGFPPLENNTSRTITIDVDYASEFEALAGSYFVNAGVILNAEQEPFVAYLGWELTAIEVEFADMDAEAGEAVDLALTAVDFVAQDNSGSGGSRIMKSDFPGVTAIEILGYYDARYVSPEMGMYLPAAYPESLFVEVTPTPIDPAFLSGDAWGWYGGDEPVAFPEDRYHTLCKVSLDGGPAVVALLVTAGGV